MLTVSAERQWQPSDEQQVVASVRPQGTFRRQMFLGEGLDVDHVDAGYEHGVLTITIPVAEQAKPRRVEITTNGNGDGKSIEATSRNG